MRDYELVYILDPDLTEEAITGAMARVQTLAENQSCEIQSQERWEKRRLAYEINRKREGVYVVMEFKGAPTVVEEIDRVLKISDGILRHIIVRAEDVKSPVDLAREAASTIEDAEISADEEAVEEPILDEAIDEDEIPDAEA